MANPIFLISPKNEALGDKVALIDENRSWTGNELMRRAGDVAAALPALAGFEDRCIVSLKNGPDFFAGLVGCWAQGVTPVVLDPAVRSELAFAAKMTDAKAVILGEGVSTSAGLATLVPKEVRKTGHIPKIREIEDDKPVLFLFTSGSTGKPTLVPKTFRQIEVEANFIFELFNRPSRVAGLIPWCHIWGLLSTFFVPLKHGGVCDLGSGISARGILERAAENALDLAAGVPVYYQAMVRLLEEGVVPPFKTRCRFASASAPLSPELRARFKKMTGTGITDILGSTETGGIAFRHEDGPWTAEPHVEIKIDEAGRLYARSPSVSFDTRDGFVAVGDMAEPVEGGFVLLGRQDDVVKIGGRRIALSEITRTVEACPGVFHAAVAAETVAGTLRLSAYVEPKNPELRAKDVKAFVRSRLADHKVPRTIHIVSKLPLTSSGKLDRRKLKAIIDENVRAESDRKN